MANTPVKRPTTKEELKKLLAMWPNSTVDEIVIRLNRNRNWVNGMVSRLRKAGARDQLPRKSAKGLLDGLIKEVVDEI